MTVLTEDEIRQIPNLFPAIRDDEIEPVKQFVIQFPDFIDAKMTNFNGTMLMMAAYYGKLKILELLLRYGANPAVGNETGTTPLMWACMDNHYECAKYLLDYGADVRQASHHGHTALIEAVKVNRDHVVNLLLDYRANINHHTYRGETALLISSSWCHRPCVKTLLDRGANRMIADVRNHLPETVPCLYIWDKTYEEPLRQLIQSYD